MTTHYASPPDSFFGLWQYQTLMHDAADHCLVYEAVTIERDISLVGCTDHGPEIPLMLKKGETFHQVNFCLVSQTFEFIDWKAAVRANVTIEPSRLVSVAQSIIAPLCKW